MRFQGLIIARGRYVSGQVVRASSPRRIRRRIALTEKAWEDAVQGGKLCSVAVVSSPLQFGPLTYQPTECLFISSSQSLLWSCLLHVTSQLGEGCSMSLFVSFSWCCGRLVYETVLERFPQWVFRGFKEVGSMFETFLGQSMCSYVGELESLGQGWKHKPRAQIKSWKKDSSKKNDPVGRRSDAMIFDLLR